ncbi:hypothetical protein ACHAW5_004594 [Stephanodiscus triporus]|uniref:RING-type domain-containing protein n=1 Tax=Stephanodiscus triporus TaxID=2934178 RepID=A0ABD3P3H3_9STRA
MWVLILFMLYPGPSPVGGQLTKALTCSLNALPTENIALPSVQHTESGHAFRHLLRGTEIDAILLPSERRTHAESDESIVYISARPCNCANRDPHIADKYYCPEQSNYCTILRSTNSNIYSDYSVTCSTNKGWKILFVRSSWFYICWIGVLFLIALIFSTPGHHAIRYPISRCFPQMNLWITEHLLQTEIQSRNRIRDEFEHAARLKRRTEGWISGYLIKTKLHSSRDASTNKDSECNGTAVTEDQTAIEDIPQDCPKRNGRDCMCTICLLELEVGDRVADLSCGHMYHAECLGEWILKKKTCPLCQDSNIATEIRCFEMNDDGNDHESCSEDRITRWRREAYDFWLDIATGRSRRVQRRIIEPLQ